MATDMTRSVPLSPASSIASFPASDDISDFSDSDFDIISSSDSTRSHEDDVRRALEGVRATSADNHFSDDDETFDQSIEPALLLDREWYGMIDAQRAQSSPSPPDAENSVAASATAPNPLALSDEDVSVIDALSQSLERSSESIRASARPISASVANVHFITSPTGSVKLRRGSSPLSRSRQQVQELDYTSSPSSEVLQLAFPDPLSTSESSLGSQSGVIVPANPIGDVHPDTVNNESVLPKEAETSTTAPPPAGEQNLAADEPKLEKSDTDAELVEAAHEEPERTFNDEKAALDDTTKGPIDQVVASEASGAYRPFFDAFDDYLAIIIKHLSATVVGNRWTASVIVSVLALIIGGVTYLGASSTPSPTPSLLLPSTTTLWGMLYPVNKSSVPPQPSPALTSQTATDIDKDSSLGAGGLRDMSLNLFAPWAVSVSPSPADIHVPGPRGIKRKRGGPVQTLSKQKEATKASEATEAQPTPALTIDAPRLHRAKAVLSSVIDGTSSPFASSSRSVAIGEHILSLPDTRVLTAAIRDYLYPVASLTYDALSDDLVVLMRALDELLAAIQSQTAQLSSVLSRTKQEASFRHARAKENARRLKRKGSEVFSAFGTASERGRTRAKAQADGFKRTVAVAVAHGERLAVDPAGTIKDLAKGVKQDVMQVAEGMREGFRQGLRIRKTTRDEIYETGAFGSSGGPRSHLTDPVDKKKKKNAKTIKSSSNSLTRRERRAERRERRRLARLARNKEKEESGGGTGFLSGKAWSRQEQATNPPVGSCATCGHNRFRRRAEMMP